MATLIKSWVISVFVWPVFLPSLILIKRFFQSKSKATVNKFLSQLGWTFIGAGGFGMLAGMSSSSSLLEIQLRASGALVFILFGAMLVFVNMDE